MNRKTMHWYLSYLLLVALFLTMMPAAPVYTAANTNPSTAAPARISSAARAQQEPDESTGLTIVLSEGAEQPSESTQMPVAETTPLNDSEVQQIADRLPPMEAETGDTEELRLPERSLPPPRTGDTIQEPFPPAEQIDAPAAPDDVGSGPLEVLRYAPEGEVPIAPFLNVTFNQPMITLGTLEQLSAADVPVVLTPELPGVWKWLGTKTLSFEYASDEIDRFPMATEYTVEIPAGTTSVVGGVLAERVVWTFSTPTVQVVSTVPTYGPQPLDPLMFVSFNQQIDAQSVLETITVSAGRQTYQVRLADEAELAENEPIQQMIDRTPDQRWLAFRAVEPFPTNTTVNVVLGPNIPSAEGPLTAQETQSFSFQTYAPLRIDEARCSYYDQDCPPFAPLSIIFNNPLDPEAFDESQISIAPAIPGVVINQFGNSIQIEGMKLGSTRYEVTVSGDVRDLFGQTLGEDETHTFRTSAMPSYLTGPDFLTTLDPSALQPTFDVYSVNYPRLVVKAYAVDPSDWPAYVEYMRELRYEENPPDPPGVEVISETIQVDDADDQLTETAIDLSPALEGETNHVIVAVTVPSIPVLDTLMRRSQPTVISWVQVTQIGLDALTDHSEMTAWATALSDGAPLDGVELSLLPTGTQTATDEEGLATLMLSDEGDSLLIGRLGTDTAILPESRYYWGEGGWQRRDVADTLRWYVFDDRQMYRPGEEVHVKGWMRLIGGKQDGDVRLPQTSGVSVQYTLVDSRGNEVLNDVVEVNDLAGFDMAFTLPENMNLGQTYLRLNAQGLPDLSAAPMDEVWLKQHDHTFQVQEFRRPEFEVSAGNETEGPYFLGGEATVSASAAYFAGGPLPNAETFWAVSASPSNYSPPNWPDFIFGEWTPWWAYGGWGWDDEVRGPNTQTFNARTDASGRHFLKMEFTEVDQPRPYSVIASADIMDVNRQSWNANTSLLVHPASLYVGMRSETTFVEKGEPLIIEAIVTDLDGNAIPGQIIDMEAARLEWKTRNGEWSEEAVNVQECSIESTMEAVACTFDTEIGGRMRISASVMDDQGRINRSRMTRWVSGGERPPAREVTQEEVELIPDKEQYEPGDVAEILVQAPFSPAEGLLTVARSGILYTERFTIDQGSTTLRLLIEDAHIPNISVQVDLNGAAPRVNDQGETVEDAPSRPAFATGSIDLIVPPLNRTLTLKVMPESTELAPGESTPIDLTLTDAEGKPVEGGELAVVVVDEAILALTGYQLADPVAAFYQQRYADVAGYHSRSQIVLQDAAVLAAETEERLFVQSSRSLNKAAGDGTSMEMAESMAAADSMAFDMEAPAMAMAPMAMEEVAAFDDGGGAPSPAITVRSDFNPLATFAPEVRTDENGQARVDVSLPDNLTRYRIMVAAVADGDKFGSGEANLTARMPLMVRPSAPRFLNFGDAFEVPVVLQNQTNEPIDVDVLAQVANLALTNAVSNRDAGQRVTVPANDRVEIRFPAATVNAGTARIRFAATSGDLADAANVVLPVYTPATTEAFATYGVVDEGTIVQPIATPENVFPQFGGLEITTSSTSLQALTDAVLYLTAYPFECSEQLASRVLGIAALRDVLTAFQADGLPSPEALNAAVARDIERLEGMQNMDGGFPIWRRGQESIPFYSIHAAYALQEARLKGYDVSDASIDRALDYLREIELRYPYWYSRETQHALSSYALFVRQLAGDVDPAKANRLLSEMPLEDQSLEALAWLWQVLSGVNGYEAQVEGIRRTVNNSAVETAGAANFITSYGDDEYVMLHSNRRTDGIVLDALIVDQPESDLIPKVVNGLLAHQTRGRWNNTQENVFILLALDRYFNTYEAESPDFVARMWLGNTYVGEHAYVGYSTDSHATNVPMAYLVDSSEPEHDLIVEKDGNDGRLYYRLGMSYAPDDLELDPLEMGFVVQREYEATDDPDDVVQYADGSWHIRAGASVRVRLTMVADSRRYHVALVDPLPAGLEIVNPDLAVSAAPPQEPGQPEPYFWSWGPWYQHQNLRDHQAEAFTTLLWDGVYEYTYTARATTPGEFVVPPAKAEEMYSPEVFGRSGSDVVIVE